MYSLERIRRHSGFSQRKLAEVAGVPFRTIQLMEGRGHDPQISTLQKISTALGYPRAALRYRLSSFFKSPPESVDMTSEKIIEDGESSWKIHLFDFVDEFRSNSRRSKERLIFNPPLGNTPPRIKALLASTVETLCDEKELPFPEWTLSVLSLREPWFVSGIEGLKATALMESPIHFRKRNIFVLENFLSRA